MTDQYIITEEQLSNIEQDAPERVVLTCDAVRTHPYNPQAHEHGWFTDWEMEQAELKGYNRGNDDGQEYARKAEREKVLDEVLKSLDKKGSAYKYIRAKFVQNDNAKRICPTPRTAPACKECNHLKPHNISESCFSRCFFGQTCSTKGGEQG